MAIDSDAVDAAVGPSTLKVLGDPVRWEIVRRLGVEDLCVCHLVEDLDLAQPLVSHHLRVLREAGVVEPERCGPFTYYVLDRDTLRRLARELGELGTTPRRPRRRPCT
ncbi:MAG: helix-turn-helix transcriptional regulator [Actinobacteria bacterium]|nr:MAG: helix-turn-helix transcriptional regulator [Actinomycetota bacterium]